MTDLTEIRMALAAHAFIPRKDELIKELLERCERAEEATDKLYWFYKMVQGGGPDGSDLDFAVTENAERAVSKLERARAVISSTNTQEQGLR